MRGDERQEVAMRSAIGFDLGDSMPFRPSPKARGGRRRAAVGIEPLDGRTLLSASLVSANALGQAGGAGILAGDPEISSDGRFVVYTTDQTDVVTGVTDTNGKEDVYIRDLTVAGPSVLVSG